MSKHMFLANSISHYLQEMMNQDPIYTICCSTGIDKVFNEHITKSLAHLLKKINFAKLAYKIF